MKKLSKINEGTLWGNTIMRSDTGRVRKEDDITEEYVMSFFKKTAGWYCHGVEIKNVNGEKIININGDFILQNSEITELPFKFGKVSGSFSIAYCTGLTSLKGCPEEVGGNFYCSFCKSLTSLEGGPKIVKSDYICAFCDNLETLNGVAKHIGKELNCGYCKNKFKISDIRKICDVRTIINRH